MVGPLVCDQRRSRPTTVTGRPMRLPRSASRVVVTFLITLCSSYDGRITSSRSMLPFGRTCLTRTRISSPSSWLVRTLDLWTEAP